MKKKIEYDWINIPSFRTIELIELLIKAGVYEREAANEMQYLIYNELITVEHDVTDEERFKNMRTFLRPEVSDEVVWEHINSPHYAADKVRDRIIRQRPYIKDAQVSAKLEKLIKKFIKEEFNL